ncbi:MAG: TSUP family transporter [Oleispira sp.]|nr:TSUP family transporter [Oleispira sp.]MBL4880039.1 TSUP family transporter [Oleispira sp.]
MEFSFELLAILSVVAIAAGFIDAIAGGGGLLTIPALLFTGMSPVQAIATNKLQACFGSFTATRFFIKQKLVSPKKQRWGILAASIGAAFGAIAIQLFDSSLLITLLPFALILIAAYLVFAKNFGQPGDKPKLDEKNFNGSFITGIGFYDGFFGPGTGTFFTLSYCKMRALSLIQATAHAKLMNFTTNIVSLFIFILSDQILWQVGLAMAVGQIIGARIGAATAIKQGTNFIRYMTVAVCIAMSISLLLKQ